MIDPFETASGEPASILSGSFAAWTIGDAIDPTLFSLKYVFLQGDQLFEKDLASVSTVWTFVADGAFTGQLATGRQQVNLVVTRLADSEQKVIRSFTTQCFASLSERTSHARVMVDKIESILSGRADSDVESYTIKSRSISKMSVRELTDWREYYLAELGREVDPVTGKRSTGNTLKVGFK